MSTLTNKLLLGDRRRKFLPFHSLKCTCKQVDLNTKKVRILWEN